MEVSKFTYVLLPLSETGFFGLDLLRKALPERLFLFLKFGVVHFLDLWFAKLPRLHLLLPVVFVVQLLRCRDEVEHVRADEQRAQLAEITVTFILNFSDTPEVLATLDDATIRGLDVFGGAND